MGMLKSISLQNYKCFKDETTIDIAPLTVLCGVNSSGKSSILKSLLMMKQSFENESPYNEMTFNGRWVDNGYFNDIIYHDVPITVDNEESYDKFTILNTFQLENTGNSYKHQDLQSFKELKKIFFFVKEIEKIKLSIELVVTRSNNHVNDLSYYVENNRVSYCKIIISLLNKNDEVCKESFVSIKKYGNDERIYSLSYNNIPYYVNNIEKHKFESKSNVRCTCYFSNMHLKNIYRENMDDILISIKPTILSIFDIASWQYDGLSFIAPLRQQPQRNYVLRGNIDSVGIDGGDTPILLAKQFGKEITTNLFYKNRNNNQLDSMGQIRDKYKVILQEWLDALHLGEISIQGDNGLINVNISGHNLVDVGFGISQILPILVQGIYMQRNQTLMLEQPEIHLHPKMQMQLADFMISLANSGRNTIIETHSDHIVNRIVRRVMEDQTGELKQKIKIYFINRDVKNHPKINLININEFNGIDNAPDEFFTQFGTEIQNIAKVGINNYRKSTL